MTTMANKRKVNLSDYELTTTLGTGKWLGDSISSLVLLVIVRFFVIC